MNNSLWFIAILPPDDVAEKIRDLQREIADRFGPRRALKIPVHITLESPFRYVEAKAAELDRLLRNFFRDKESFELELKNFGSFRNDVIFVEVSPSLPLVELHAGLKEYLHVEKKVVEKPAWHGGFTPHLTVANRDVTPVQFREIWKEFNTRKFYAKFRAVETSLLQHDTKQWRVQYRYPLLAKGEK